MTSIRSLSWLFCLILLSLSAHASDVDILTAAEQGDLGAVKTLVQGNPRLLAAVDDRGYSPLHRAAYNNRVSVAEYLIAQGADINAKSRTGSTPLHGAASYGHFDVARLLLDNGAAINVVNAGGFTPLLSACLGGQWEIARLLIDTGADVNASAGGQRTPLGLAVWSDDAEVVKYLLNKGANANIPAEEGVSLPYFAMAYRSREVGQQLFDKITDFAERDSLGLTLLHFMAARGYEDLIEKLLNQGVAPNVKDNFGKTPLSYASAWGHDRVVSILEARGATPNEAAPTWFKGGLQERPAPGKIPVAFAGDELRTPFALHGGIALSPDGKEMLWCDHAPMRGMWYIKQVDGAWQQPILAPFTDLTLDHTPGHPSFSADGNRLYFHSRRDLRQGEPSKTNSDICFVKRTGSGWSQPESVGSPINTEENESGPTIAPSGNLYFVGEGYKNGFGAGDIYVSELVNGTYTAPRNLGPSINSEDYEMPAAVSSDENYMIFASNRPYLRQRSLQLFVSFKDKGEWTKAVSLGRTIDRRDAWDPFITADDKFVFYQQGTSYYWFSTALIDDVRQAVVGSENTSANVSIPLFRKTEQVFEHAATNHIALGDLDGDGDLDAVFSNMGLNDSRVYLNDGHGRFTVTEQLLTKQGHGVQVGDLDGDGDLDIFMACASFGFGGEEFHRPSRVYFNDGKANFTMSPQNFGDSLLSGNGVELADIDMDGDLDAMIVYYQTDNRTYLNDGHGQFALSDVTFPRSSTWTDLDGDGDVDIFARIDGVGFKTLLNDGTGHFTEYWSKTDSSLTRGGVGLGDMDGDSDPDAVISFLDQSERRFSEVWYNDGTGRFTESDIKLPLTRYATISMGDLNGDGHLDAFLNNFGLPSAVWLNDGKGRLFDSGIRLPGEWMNTGCPLGDLDGDGDLDVFIAAFGSGPNEIWFNEQ